MLVSSLLCFPFNFFVPMLVIWGAMFCTSLLVPIRFSAWHCLCNLCLFVHTCALLVIFQAFLFLQTPLVSTCSFCFFLLTLYFFSANIFSWQRPNVSTCSSLCFPCTFWCQYLFMSDRVCMNLLIITVL